MIIRISLFILIIVSGLTAAGQGQKYFEGEITYQFTFKADRVPDAAKLLSPYLGEGSILYFKEGNYRHEFIGGLLEFDLYNKEANKIYLKKRNNDTIFWTDCGLRGDTIQKFSYSPKTDTIIGIVCDRLVIQYKGKSETHFYNSDSARINPAWFENFKLNDEYLVDKKEQSIYLKGEHSFERFTLIETATKLSAENVNDEKFKLPANAILAPGE